MSIPTPTIHRNGTDPRTLAADYGRAAETLRAALDALATCAPNARDYYLQGPDAIRGATAAHEDRMAMVRAVQREIDAIRWAIADTEPGA